MLRLVCESSAAITNQLIEAAKGGHYLSAKFLFEAVGLSAVKGEELEDSAERETLASVLLKQWQVPPLDGQVTEVAQNPATLASAAEAPVKSETGQAQEMSSPGEAWI